MIRGSRLPFREAKGLKVIFVALSVVGSETVTKKDRLTRKSNAESQQIGGEFADFLRNLGNQEVVLDISKNVKAIIEKLQMMGDSPIEDFSEFVINFYQAIGDRMHSKAIYKSESKFLYMENSGIVVVVVTVVIPL